MPTTVEQEIVRCTLEVFTVLMGCDAVSEVRGCGYGREDKFGLVSSLRLSGSVQGAAHVRYTLPMATHITCRMLEEEPPIAPEAILDAMGELANMIVGSVKSSLEGQLGSIRIGTPITSFPLMPPRIYLPWPQISGGTENHSPCRSHFTLPWNSLLRDALASCLQFDQCDDGIP